jgi:hypothetical protein
LSLVNANATGIGSKLTMADMGTVHDLIEAKGKVGTLAYDFDRAVVEAASTYMADEDAGIGFLYSGRPSQTWGWSCCHAK